MIEYKVINSKRDRDLQGTLNGLSREGWKVVCSCYPNLILRRRLRVEE